MRVLLYSSQFPTPRDPNGGIFTAQLAQAMARHAEVDAVCPLPWCPDWSWFRRHPHWGVVAGVPASGRHGDIAVRYPKYPLIPRLSGPWQALLQAAAVWFALRRLLQARAYDVINAHWLYPDGVAATLLGRWLGVPVVLTALGSDVNVYARMRARRPQIRWALGRARAVTAVSRALRERLVELMGDVARLHYIPNGVDTARFFPLDAVARAACRRRLGLDPDRRYVVFVGRLHPVKGVPLLLDALAKLAGESRLTFDTVLVGDGAERAALERQAQSLGLGGRIRFAGERPHAEVPQWLQAADVFCLPSLMEGMPNVVLEALACRVPVVATRVGAIPDIIERHTGIVVEPGSVVALADALHEACARDWRQTEQASSSSWEDWEGVARRYLSVLDAPAAHR